MDYRIHSEKRYLNARDVFKNSVIPIKCSLNKTIDSGQAEEASGYKCGRKTITVTNLSDKKNNIITNKDID